jgi:hypothetical protein
MRVVEHERASGLWVWHRLSYLLPYPVRCWCFNAAARTQPDSRLFWPLWNLSRPGMSRRWFERTAMQGSDDEKVTTFLELARPEPPRRVEHEDM